MRKLHIAVAAGLAATLLSVAPTRVRADEAHVHPVRINCGGGTYLDAQGAQWEADAHFTGGTPYFRSSGEIGGTLDDPLYLSERYGNSTYAIPLPDGEYAVNLRFAEIYWFQPGQRLFDVTVEGEKILADLDLVATVGALHALDVMHTATVTDGALTIVLDTGLDNAKIAAIEVLPVETGGTGPSIALTPENLDFGLVNVSESSATQTFSMTNTGDALLTVSGVNLLGVDAAHYDLIAESSYLIGPGESRGVSVQFSPTSTGDKQAQVSILSNAGGAGIVSVGLIGTAVLPQTPGLEATPTALDFGSIQTGIASTELFVRLDSTGTGSVEVTSLAVEGPDAATFSIAGTAPQSLPVGSSTTVSVLFTPQDARAHSATLRIGSTDPDGDLLVSLTGQGISAPNAAFRINVGGSDFTDLGGRAWTPDDHFSGGATFNSSIAIAGTEDDALYQSERYGDFAYGVPTGNGTFDVTLHFAEIYWTTTGSRVFDVKAEGVTIADDLDLVAAAGTATKYTLTREVTVSDDVLSLTLVTGVDNAKLSAIEVVRTGGTGGSGILSVAPFSLEFDDTVLLTASPPQTLTLSNQGTAEVDVTSITVEGAHALDFSTTASSSYALLPGATVTFDVIFTPNGEEHRSAQVRLVNSGSSGDVVVPIHGHGVTVDTHGFMHAVAGPHQTVTDADENGVEIVTLNAAGSHTHEQGMSLESYFWREGGQIIASGVTPDVTFTTGVHTIELTITDLDGKTHSDTTVVTVVDPSHVPGLLANYAEGVSFSFLPDFDTLTVTYTEIVSELNVPKNHTSFLGVPSIENFVARFSGSIDAPVTGSYDFFTESDDGSKLYVDGQELVTNDGLHDMDERQGTIHLDAGRHDIVIEYMQQGFGMGLIVRWQPPGGTKEIIPASVLSHMELGTPPSLSSIAPAESAEQGGELIMLTGLGFLDEPVVVHFGPTEIPSSQFATQSFDTIEVLSPPGSGIVDLHVSNAHGTSGSIEFRYGDDVASPVSFDVSDLIDVGQPTTLAFGPDGRLYVGTISGEVKAYTLNDSGDVVATSTYSAIQALGEGRVILAIAFNPSESGPYPAIYVSHSKLFDGSQLYPGKVSVVRGPAYSTVEDLVTGLPASDHDHATNGLAFGPLGEMYISQGGNTNAGVPHSSFGLRDEAALSGAVLVAHLERPGFNGFVSYDQTITPGTANQIGGLDVEVFAPGMRNPYDLVFHSNGEIYATDNGPNLGFGASSTDCGLEGPSPFTSDELNRVRQDEYYGHPNRNRGRTDSRQCVFRSAEASPGAGYTQPIASIPSSSNGIAEYTANTFGGQMRGDLLIVQFNQVLRRYELSAGGDGIDDEHVLGGGGLDVTQGPRGGIYVADYGGNKVLRYTPNEPAPVTFAIRDTFPNSGSVAGGTTQKITGVGFGAIGGTTVLIGGQEMTLTLVTPTEITGLLPAGAGAGAVDVVITTGGTTKTFSKGFRYVGAATGTPGGTWETGPDLPFEMGETSAATIGDEIFTMSGSGNNVVTYDIDASAWHTDTPNLPGTFPGSNHVMMAAVNGKLYVLGGVSPMTAAVHSYSPDTGEWTELTSIQRNGQTYALGGAAVGVIGTKIYVAGGFESFSDTSNATLCYDTATDTWTEVPNLPDPLNHAGGVGFGGKLWVFGGRFGFDFPHDGSDKVQVYDPASDSWDTTTYVMPTARASIGAAVEVNGRLLVMGGEGGGPVNGVFPYVEELDPFTNTWRNLVEMPTPRHGAMPVRAGDGNVYVAGGGLFTGFALSGVLEVFHPEGSGDLVPPTVSLAEAPDQGFEHAPELTLSVVDDVLLSDVTYRFDDGATHVLLSGIGQPFVTGVAFTPDDDDFHALADGAHTLRIEASDAGGNVGVLSWSFYKGAPVGAPTRVNCGGNTHVDGLGQTWLADQGFFDGAMFSTSAGIDGTDEDALYQTERYGSFSYEFAVPDGTYLVQLHFAEIYTGTFDPGSRVASFATEGSIFVADVDISAEVGPLTALVKSFTVTVSDGALTITSVAGIENPKLSAIQFRPQP